MGLLKLGGGTPLTLGFVPDRMVIGNGQSWVNYQAHLQYYEVQLAGSAGGGVGSGRIGTSISKKGIITADGALKWHEIRIGVNAHTDEADYYLNVQGVELANTITVVNGTTGSYSDDTECAVTRGQYISGCRDVSPIATGYISQSFGLYAFKYD